MFLADLFLRLLAWIRGWLRPLRLVIVGPSGSGKTTMLHFLKSRQLARFNPTVDYHCEELSFKGRRVHTIDVAGNSSWEEHLVNADGIIFVIDASSSQSIPESYESLREIIKRHSGTPILVFGNKCDVPGSSTEKDIRDALQLPGDDRVKLVLCSVESNIGLDAGIYWLRDTAWRLF